MNPKRILLPAAAFIMLSLSSCKKESNTDDTEIETTFELSAKEGTTENLTQDTNDVLNEVAQDNNLQGNGFIGSTATNTNILSCATITITPQNTFPKNIIIDFGVNGCTSQNGVFRKGKILVTLSDSLRHSGSVATMTFDNYFINGFKKEGNITFTNNSTASTKVWTRNCQNGKITAPDGSFWTHSGTQTITQTAGSATPINLLDDVFSITGNRTVTNAAGRTRVGTILTPLQKKTICENIDKGTYQIQGPNHVAIINFGNGDCDRLATISIDGRPERTFLLR